MMNRLILSLSLLLFIGCKAEAADHTIFDISYDDQRLNYEGRIGVNTEKTGSEFYWPGSSIEIQFEGTSVTTTLDDQKGENYFNVILDGKIIKVLHLKKGKHRYSLATDLLNTKHQLLLTKRNDWPFGKTVFFGFEVIGSKILPASAKKPYSIEFYGDSITVGYGNEDYSGNDAGTGDVTNNYLSYAAITARNINASYSCIAHSGIGIMVSWHTLIMPEIFDRLNPGDKDSKWDFSKEQPDIVVINLMQNDSWIVKLPNNIKFKRRFGTTKPDSKKIIADYSNFVKGIRSRYPNSSIICLLGNMDITKQNSEWPSYIEKAVIGLADPNIYSCFVPYKASPGHPKVEEQQLIANKLTELIKSKILH